MKDIGRIREIYDAAEKYFVVGLNNNSERVMTYLNNKGIYDESVECFHIGYADRDAFSLCNYLKEMNYSNDELSDCGLIRVNPDGKYSDVFVDRIIYPIYSEDRSVVGFSGLSFTGENPVYLNISRNCNTCKLFGTPLLDDKGTVVLCEGVNDVIHVHQCGYSALCSVGDVFSDYYLKYLKQKSTRVIICFDSDDYGRRKSSRLAESLREIGVETHEINPSPWRDAAEFINKSGVSTFSAILKDKGNLE